ncbi:hypothetical protein N2152v2_006714 [Parachlorella kessleri]
MAAAAGLGAALEVQSLARPSALSKPRPSQGVPVTGAGQLPPQAAATSAHAPPLSAAQLLFWLAFAAVQPCLTALFGVLTRYLEVRTTPSVPPLRITCIMLLFAMPPLLLLYSLPRHLYLRRRRAWKREQQQRGQLGSNGNLVGTASASHAGGTASSEVGGSDEEAAAATSAKAPVGPTVPGAEAVAGLSRVPTLPGLSRVYDRHPRVHRTAVLLAVSASYLGVIVLLNFAPKFVDPSIVMLSTLFTVVGVALWGRLWLKIPLPRPLPFAAAAMIGGAVMIVVPNVISGEGSAQGSLTTGTAWMGFGLAIGALLLTIAYLTLLQAFKYAKLNAEEVMYWLAGLCAVTVLPLSLALEGSDWGDQFRGFNRKDWAAFLFCCIVALNGTILGIQWATMKLGSNTVAMFMGLRLIASIVASKIILGATVVKTGVQIAGVALLASSITAYMGFQWWEARRLARAALRQPPSGASQGEAAAAPH